MQAVFMQKFNQGRILDDAATSDQLKWVAKFANVQCLPLFSLLAAINVTTVDYFSLDVEGSELGVLRTIPFDKVLIRVCLFRLTQLTLIDNIYEFTWLGVINCMSIL